MPDWMKGKTFREIAELTSKLYDAVVAGATAATPTSTAPTPAMSTPSPAVPQPPDPNLFYSDPNEYQRQLLAFQQHLLDQKIQQVSTPFLASQAQIARNTARQDPEYADVWSAYAPEIDALMAPLPLEQRANPEMWRQAAELVAGRHRRELAAKLAEKMRAEIPDTGTVGAGIVGVPGVSTAPTDPIAKLFAEDHPSIQKFKQIGYGPDKVRAHALAMGHTPEAYAEMLTRKQSFHYYESGTPK